MTNSKLSTAVQAISNTYENNLSSYIETGMEVSLWHNDEGFDVHLSSHGDQFFNLSWGQFKALKKLVKELDND